MPVIDLHPRRMPTAEQIAKLGAVLGRQAAARYAATPDVSHDPQRAGGIECDSLEDAEDSWRDIALRIGRERANRLVFQVRAAMLAAFAADMAFTAEGDAHDAELAAYEAAAASAG